MWPDHLKDFLTLWGQKVRFCPSGDKMVVWFRRSKTKAIDLDTDKDLIGFCFFVLMAYQSSRVI